MNWDMGQSDIMRSWADSVNDFFGIEKEKPPKAAKGFRVPRKVFILCAEA